MASGRSTTPLNRHGPREMEIHKAYGNYVMATARGLTPPVDLAPHDDQEVLIKTA